MNSRSTEREHEDVTRRSPGRRSALQVAESQAHPSPTPKPAPSPTPTPKPTPAPAAPPAPTITGILVAEDDFSQRNQTTFGVAERINLSFKATPDRTAAQLGGLRWAIDSGGGAFASPPRADGTATYVAPSAPATVTLKLAAVAGATPGAGPTYQITIVQPSGMEMTKIGGLWHLQNIWSIGFKGIAYLLPKDVSFRNVQVHEERTTADADGWLKPAKGLVHEAGGWSDVDKGNSSTGCPVKAHDRVSNRASGPSRSYGDGWLEWKIPWQYRVGRGPAVAIKEAALHRATSDPTGKATIRKLNTNVFEKALGDADSRYGVDGE